MQQPSIDTRFGEGNVTSRAGLSQTADFLLRPDTNIMRLPMNKDSVHCMLVDEAQFLQPEQVNQLRLVTDMWKVPVICYGLRTDFRSNFFPGSRRLMEVADTIEEIKTTCHFCTDKAVLNLKHVNGRADTSGPTVQLGAEERYFPTCFACYRRSVNEADQSPVGVWGPNAEELFPVKPYAFIRETPAPLPVRNKQQQQQQQDLREVDNASSAPSTSSVIKSEDVSLEQKET